MPATDDAAPQQMRVKICGVTSPDDALAAVRSGADYIGLNFFPPAKRSIRIDQAPAILAGLPRGIVRTALLVDPDDDLVDRVIDPGMDMIQLHGNETPDRVAEVKSRTGLPVMKVISIRDPSDLAGIDAHAPVADQLLIDAKAPEGSNIPGGHGVPFDWTLLAGRDWTIPWMLAGGLTAENVAQAITHTGACQVDVASGVEAAPGTKDHAKMLAFIQAAKAPA